VTFLYEKNSSISVNATKNVNAESKLKTPIDRKNNIPTIAIEQIAERLRATIHSVFNAASNESRT